MGFKDFDEITELEKEATQPQKRNNDTNGK